MTTAVWNDWIDKLNAEMIRQNREIAPLVDNCSSHPVGDRYCLFSPTNYDNFTSTNGRGHHEGI
jgi:hypothetical protein